MADSQKVATIGASVVHLISSRPSSPTNNKPLSSTVAPSKPATPCLLLPDPRRAPRTMVLNGPKKSGKTSIAMNLAYSCASNFACQCVDASGCECMAALFFRSTSEKEADFPATCHIVSSEDDKKDFSSRYSDLQDRTKEKIEGFDPSVLKQIRVVYVSSVQDILFELLSLLGKSVPLQACRCIIIDDLDQIASSEVNPTASMMQTLAVAIETSNTLKNLIGISSMVLATAESKIVAPWIETPVSLKSAQNPPVWQQGTNEYALSVSHWRATIPLENHMGQKSSTTVEYSVTKSSGGAFRIYWREV